MEILRTPPFTDDLVKSQKGVKEWESIIKCILHLGSIALSGTYRVIKNDGDTDACGVLLPGIT